jgi:hypothetical protein
MTSRFGASGLLEIKRRWTTNVRFGGRKRLTSKRSATGKEKPVIEPFAGISNNTIQPHPDLGASRDTTDSLFLNFAARQGRVL